MNSPVSLQQLTETEPAFAAELAAMPSAERLLAWFPTREISLNTLDMEAQDEFSHDLIAPMKDGRWLSFALT